MHVVTVLCAHMSEDSIVKRLHQPSLELSCLAIVNGWLGRVDAAYSSSQGIAIILGTSAKIKSMSKDPTIAVRLEDPSWNLGDDIYT